MVWGSGKPLRQFIYSIDLGRLIVWAVREYEDSSPLILSVPEESEISIQLAARCVAKSMGCDHLIVSFLYFIYYEGFWGLEKNSRLFNNKALRIKKRNYK